MYAPATDLFANISRPPVLDPVEYAYLTDGEPHALHIDFEGRCRRSIKVVGGDNWAREAEALCLAYAVDDGAVELWWRGDAVPPAAFFIAARDPQWIVISFNAAFERSVFRHILIPQHEFPDIPLAQWRCSQAMAVALALPAELDLLAEALDLVERKDAAGHKLMLKMTKPVSSGANVA
jgi:DNA polymerase bacteriophage-type